MDEKTYEQERKASLDAEYSDAEHYDKWLLTLSSGAFGISIAFMRYIAPNPTPDSKCYLIVAWVSLLLSILATLVSLQVSQLGFRRYRHIIEEMKSGSRNPNLRNVSATLVNLLNWVSLVLFIVGTAMLAVFSFLNLGG